MNFHVFFVEMTQGHPIYMQVFVSCGAVYRFPRMNVR